MINVDRMNIKQGGNARNSEILDHLLNMYHNDPRKFTDGQREQLAKAAYMAGKSFDVKSKALQKGAFDFADMALLGLIPNTLRPRSIGQEYHGEKGIDKLAGGLGTAAGLVPAFFTGGLAVKGASKLASAGVGMAGKAKAGYDAARAGRYAGMGGSGRVGAAVGRVKEAAAKARADMIAKYKQGYSSVPWAPGKARGVQQYGMPIGPQQLQLGAGSPQGLLPQFASGGTGRPMSFFDIYR